MEKILLRGYFYINGKWYPNLITNRGATILFERVFQKTDIPPFEYIGIGLGATPVDENDTALEYEIFRKKGILTQIPNSKYCTLSVTFNKEEGNGLISEIGIFNKSSGGDMLDRSIIKPPVWKSSTEALPILFKMEL